MIKVRTKGLLFDMDGVLISSLGSVERSWQTWAERHGLNVRETIKTAHGMRAIETVRTLKPDADHEAELKVIEDLEVGDNEGLEVLGRRDLDSAIAAAKVLDHRHLGDGAAGAQPAGVRRRSSAGAHHHCRQGNERQASSRALSQGRENSGPGAGGLYCDRGFAFRQLKRATLRGARFWLRLFLTVLNSSRRRTGSSNHWRR